MTKVYLFDWGNTLMVDFPGVPGKMCNWDLVEAVEGAEKALKSLSRKSKLYIATGAAESSEADIKSAFSRVNLSQYISGYFCKENLGIEKGTPSFFLEILKRLNVNPNEVIVVGDSLSRDIEPAIAVGISAIWLSKGAAHQSDSSIKTISSLRDLCLL